MCGIGGIFAGGAIDADSGNAILERINAIQYHRGPDGHGTWLDARAGIGLAHTRLSIIDLTTGAQPMRSDSGNVITYNGEIYNYLELRAELADADFQSASDTEVILRAYERWGAGCVDRLRGMFAFALWDAKRGELFVARDRFGIKPFYYALLHDRFYFASEAKAILPFFDRVHTDLNGLHDYFCFQFCLGTKTLFAGLRQIEPAHRGYVGADLTLRLSRYWDVHYDLDWNHTEKYFGEKVRERLFDSVAVHLRSDVEVGAYVSGGIDSSLVASIARDHRNCDRLQAFTGKFSLSETYDESRYARALAVEKNLLLHEIDISERDFIDNIAKTIYHLDQPTAGPGSFPQFMVSRLAKNHLKVVLGGQHARWAIRRNLRIDHFEFADTTRIQTLDSGVLGPRHIRRKRQALFSPDKPLQYVWRTHRLGYIQRTVLL
jgi:asparagine synthase (glutamine-hydrolysing)